MLGQRIVADDALTWGADRAMDTRCQGRPPGRKFEDRQHAPPT
jgi:hypothetical protein